MSRLEQAEALLRERMRGLTPAEYQAWLKRVDAHLSAAPRSITADARQAIRAGVLAEVEAERAHQDQKWGGPAHDRQHSAIEFLHFIRRYVIKADDLLSASQRPTDWPEVRRRFVQIAALSVAALENVIPLTGAHTLQGSSREDGCSDSYGTADAQPGGDSAEADGLAVGDWVDCDDENGGSGPILRRCTDGRWLVGFSLTEPHVADSCCEAETLTRIPAPKFEIGQATALGEIKYRFWNVELDCWAYNVIDAEGTLLTSMYESELQPADSAPPAEPSIAELASHRWRIGDMFCRPECSKVRLVYALDDALALVKYIREDGVLDQCNAAILARQVLASGCALGNLFDKLRTLDDLTQQLSDLAAKVEALSKPQVEAGSTKLAEAYRDGWAEGYTEGMNMTAAMISFERTQPEFAQFEPLTVERIERIRDSCHVTYNGGHHDEPAHSAFHHGMDTALNVIASKLPPAPDAQAQEGQR